MSEHRHVPLRLLPTGVPGLNTILGGGLPEYSFNLIAGTPGAGKTTLAHQIIFANATPERPALYLTVLGEPPIKMLRYQQQMAFFDPEAVGRSVYFVDLSELALKGDLATVLARIAGLVEELAPAIVVVDSFQTMLPRAGVAGAELNLQGFVQHLAVRLTSGATVLMTMEIVQTRNDLQFSANVVSFLADDIVLLHYVEIEGVLRKSLAVIKMRGSDHRKELYAYEITAGGIVIHAALREYTGILTGTAERRAGGEERGYPGLVAAEEVVLRALIALKEAPVTAAMRRTGLSESAVIAALNRLVALGYTDYTDQVEVRTGERAAEEPRIYRAKAREQ